MNTHPGRAAQPIDLHIQELVLHGFPAGDRHRIGDAVQRQLARLFAEQGVPPSLSRHAGAPHLDGGAFDVAPDSSAETIGAQVAQAVYGGLSR